MDEGRARLDLRVSIMHRAELLRSSTNGKTGIHVNGLRGFCQAVACLLHRQSFPSLLFSSLHFAAFYYFFPSPVSLFVCPSLLPLSLRSRCFSFSLFNRAARFLFRAASDPRISVIRAASLEERHCLLTRVVVEWLVAFPLPPRPPPS